MALKFPIEVTDATATPGTGTYTLSGATASRSLADAVAAGHVANGDTVYAMIVAAGSTGAARKFEFGLYTVGGAGSTLARTQVLGNHLGTTAAVNWTGGVQTVRLIFLQEGFALLAAVNTFIALQRFSGGFEVSADSVPVARIASQTATPGIIGELRFLARNSAAELIDFAYLRGQLSVAADGAEEGHLRSVLMRAGTATIAHRFNADGSITDVQGARDFAYQGVLSAPAGTILPFGSSPPPPGWTQNTTSTDAALRVVSGALGSPGGTRGLSASTVGATTLDTSQIPSHTHGPGAGTSFHMRNAGSGDSYATSPGNFFTSAAATAAAGGGGSHAHTLALKYVDVLMATKS